MPGERSSNGRLKRIASFWFAGCVIGGIMLGVMACIADIRAETYSLKTGGSLFVYTDTETGCQYLARAGEGGLTPRMSKGHEHICR